ncbi:hypothetical protein PCE1_004200 [Barthelona sp. PCE]
MGDLNDLEILGEESKSDQENVVYSPYRFNRHFILKALHPYTWLPIVWMYGTILFMNLFNTRAFEKQLPRPALYDIMFEMFPSVGLARSNAFALQWIPSNVANICLTIMFFVILISYRPKHWRSVFFVYSGVLIFRTLSFSVTVLSSPCEGMPNCPCSDFRFMDFGASTSRLDIVINYTAAAGIGGLSQPQCGDLLISGHTIMITILCVFVLEHVKHRNARLFVYFWTIIGCISIPLFRNHYTIDVIYAVLIVVLAYILYDIWRHKYPKMRIVRFLEGQAGNIRAPLWRYNIHNLLLQEQAGNA